MYVVFQGIFWPPWPQGSCSYRFQTPRFPQDTKVCLILRAAHRTRFRGESTFMTTTGCRHPWGTEWRNLYPGRSVRFSGKHCRRQGRKNCRHSLRQLQHLAGLLPDMACGPRYSLCNRRFVSKRHAVSKCGYLSGSQRLLYRCQSSGRNDKVHNSCSNRGKILDQLLLGGGCLANSFSH